MSGERREAALQRLLAIGRQRGHVTLEEVKAALPVAEMGAEELGRAMLRLEEAGVEVRLEGDLLRPRPGSEAADPPPVTLPPGAEPAPARAPPMAAPGAPFEPPPRPGGPVPLPPDGGGAGRFLGRALLLAGAALALALVAAYALGR